MKRFVLLIALSLALFGSVSAGEIPSGGIAPPPPPGDPQAALLSPGQIPCEVTGQIPTGGYASQMENVFLNALLATLGLVN